MRQWLLILSLLLVPVFAEAQDSQLSFARGGYWLTNPAPGDFLLHQTAAAKAGEPRARARLALYKLSDPALLAQIVTARALKSLSEGELLRRVAQTAPVWQSDLVLPDSGDITVPLEAAAGALAGGVYVLTAALAESPDQRAALWFARSTLAVKARFMGGRAFVAAYDLQTRAARGNLQLRWCDAAGKIIGEETLPEAGAALLTRPPEAALLLAAGDKADAEFDYVRVPQPDTARAVDGALVYPSAPQHETGKPFSFLVAAPGEPAPVFQVNGADTVAAPVMPHLWRVDVPDTVAGGMTLTVRRNSATVAESAILAAAAGELAVTWQQKPKTADLQQPLTLKFQLAAAGKPMAGEAGLLSLTANTNGTVPAISLPFKADAKGAASVTVAPGTLPPIATRYQVQIKAAGRQSDSGDAMLATYPAPDWLEITPQFSDGAVAENVTAQFTVASRHADERGRAVNVTYELAREAYRFEWYQADDGRWTYRTTAKLEKVIDGQSQPVKGVTTIAVPVSAGRYRLTVTEAGGGLAGTQSFTAGWWLAQPAPATPETIELTAQIENDSSGTADKSQIAIFIDPPFAAHVWVAAIKADGGAALPMAEIPDEGGFAYLPRSALPPGQPLRLTAFGIPSDPGATLVAAEGEATLPLGSKVGMQLERGETAGEARLTLTGLPIDQPLDKNIAQAFVALYDESDLSLLKTDKLLIDTAGVAHAGLKAERLPAKIHVRLFTVAGDRLNVTEQSLAVPPIVQAGKPASPKQRHR